MKAWRTTALLTCHKLLIIDLVETSVTLFKYKIFQNS